MCGFFGEFCPDGGNLEEQTFRALLNLSERRGPDAQEVYRDQQCTLGFNRLAILDLSREAMQPMQSPSGRRVLVFNGEIYNFRELASRYSLEDQPHCLTSDTAVLSNLADRLDPEQLADALDGMFSIVLYDRERRSLSLIRDFAGIKPLFYGVTGKRIVFASQFDQIFHHPATSRRTTNASAVRDFLQLGYMPAPATLFEGIHQVEPGCLVTFDHHLREQRQDYCRFPANQMKGGHLESSAEASTAMTEALSKACKGTVRSDVPLGCFVSGGIDSPLIAAMARDEVPNLRGYTVGVDDPALNEANIAREYCEALNMSQTILSLTESDIVSQKEAHFQAFTDPVGDYSSLPTFAITKEARRHATVMLSGDGGDELFWGYPRFYKFVRARHMLALPKSVRALASRGLRVAGKSVSYGIADGLGAWVLDTQSQMLQSDLASMLPGALANSPAIQALYRYDNDYSAEAIAHWLRYNEFYGHLQRVLAKVDRASMGNSLEVRVPFLCKDVIKTAWNIRFDAANQSPKLLLKHALAGRVPENKLNLRKMGFTVPIDAWLRTSFKEEVRDLIHNPVFAADLLAPRALQRFTESYFKHEHDHGWAIWMIYSLQKWASVHLRRPLGLSS